jgi:hypothetical protein
MPAKSSRHLSRRSLEIRNTSAPVRNASKGVNTGPGPDVEIPHFGPQLDKAPHMYFCLSLSRKDPKGIAGLYHIDQRELRSRLCFALSSFPVFVIKIKTALGDFAPLREKQACQ